MRASRTPPIMFTVCQVIAVSLLFAISHSIRPGRRPEFWGVRTA